MRFFLKTPRAKTGFTFIEVMVSMGLALVLMTVGTVSLLSFRNEQNLENEARALTAVLTSARNSSVQAASNSRWGVWVENPVDSRPNYSLYQVDEALLADPEYTGIPGTVFDKRTLRAGLTVIDPAPGTATNVIFAKRTGLPSASSSITIQLADNDALQRVVTVNGNGLIDYQ